MIRMKGPSADYMELEKGEIVTGRRYFNTDKGAYILQTPETDIDEKTGEEFCICLGLALVEKEGMIKLVSFDGSERQKYMSIPKECLTEEVIDFLRGEVDGSSKE